MDVKTMIDRNEIIFSFSCSKKNTTKVVTELVVFLAVFLMNLFRFLICRYYKT